jgi:hypothetical protein
MFRQSIIVRLILYCGGALALFGSPVVSGANLSLAWSPSVSANVAGYTLYYGVSSGHYPTVLNAGTSTNLTVTGLTAGKTYYFVSAAYDFEGDHSEFSNEITNTIPSLPAILLQPMSQTVAAGTLVVLSVDVGSTTPLSFQWYVGGVTIKGATNSTLVMPQILTANAGNYKVIASNAGGNVTSQIAAITVLNLSANPPGPTQTLSPGTYNGLFYQTGVGGAPAMTETATGFLSSLSVGANGGYSARLMVQGNLFTCSGKTTSAGEITAIAQPNQPGLSNLSLTLYEDTAFGAGRLAGVVSNMSQANPWVVPVSAVLPTNAFSQPALYLYFSPPPPGQVQQDRLFQVIVTSAGAVTLFGQLGDGTAIQQSGFVGIDGSFPVYLSLYNNTGLLAGWITFAGGAPVGDLTWIQTANPAKSWIGFTNTISFGSGPGLSTNCFQFIQ